MPQINIVCENCSAPVNTVFDPNTGTRDSEVIASDLQVVDACFVRDTITFLNSGRLIFTPTYKRGDKERMEPVYHDTYSVVCRKLVIVGGGKPGDAPPCESGDGGSNYAGKNVITYLHRLHRADNGAAQSTAATGASFNPNVWEDQSQGSNGKDGGRGADGKAGNIGEKGLSAPKFLNIVALEVVIGGTDSLIVDWHGQDGGNGGAGQRGGDGGKGMGGRDGVIDESWTGDSCGSQPGNGGNGGDGGDGGKGGNGGDGGHGGGIVIISTPANIASSGPFKSTQISYIFDGPNHGKAGDGGKGGKGATQAGHKGKRNSECEEDAEDGQAGSNGFPDPFDTGGTSPGTDGNDGGPGALKFESITPPTSGTCADIIPLNLKIDTITPNAGARNSSVGVTITGVGFNPGAAIHKVGVGGLGVNVSNIIAVSDTQITCSFDIEAAATQSAREVTVTIDADAVAKAGGFTVA